MIRPCFDEIAETGADKGSKGETRKSEFYALFSPTLTGSGSVLFTRAVYLANVQRHGCHQ